MSRADSGRQRPLREGDIVQCNDTAGIQYGVVCSDGPEARVAIPEHGMVVSARSLAVEGTRRLDNYDFILGVDVEGETHLWSRRRGIVSRRDGDQVVDTHDVTQDAIGRYLQWVEQGRGWRTETLSSRFARVLDEVDR